MIQRVLANYHLPELSCVGLLLFVGVFVAALGWVFRAQSVHVYRGLAALPLEDLTPKGEA